MMSRITLTIGKSATLRRNDAKVLRIWACYENFRSDARSEYFLRTA